MKKLPNARVCMIVKNTYTHDARVQREAKALTEFGYKVTIFCLQGANLLNSEVDVNGVNIVRVKRGPGAAIYEIYNPTNPKQNLQKVRLQRLISLFIRRLIRLLNSTPLPRLIGYYVDFNLIKAIQHSKFDIVHSHDLDTLKVGSVVSKRFKIPLIYDSHEMASGRNQASVRKSKKAMRLERRLISNANVVIMASQGYANRAMDLYGIASPEIVLNVPDVNKEFSAFFDLKKQLDLPQNEFLAVYQGSIQKNRGIEQAIEAIAITKGINLVIIGYGEHVQFLKDKVSEDGLQNRVKFFGPVTPKDLISWAHSADVGLCLIVGESESYKHSMPNKLFESMMSEIPVIASDYPGMGTFVERNKVGLTCDPQDPNAIALALNELRGNQSLYLELKRNTLVASETYNWSNEKNKLKSIYSIALAGIEN